MKKACNDKIIQYLNKENVKDKILNGEIKRDNANNEDVCEFLRLLETPITILLLNNKKRVIYNEHMPIMD